MKLGVWRKALLCGFGDKKSLSDKKSHQVDI